MILREVQVSNFRNIIDSTPVDIQEDVTSLIGKNESGKTAFMYALYLLNPARPNAKLSVPDQYPAWLEKSHRQQGIDLEGVRPVTATFELTPTEMAKLADRFGPDTFLNKRISVSRTYGGTKYYDHGGSEEAAVKFAAEAAGVTKTITDKASGLGTFADLIQYIETLEAGSEPGAAQSNHAQSLRTQVTKMVGDKSFGKAVVGVLSKWLPTFFYYSQYSYLPYTVEIRYLLRSDEEDLDDDELTALSLLRLAAADDDYLLNPDYERRTRELENTANAITQDVLEYWSQNPNLRVLPDITQRVEKKPDGNPDVVLDELKIRIWDERHLLSLPFDEHSTGFRWFFSFLAAFSRYELGENPIIILLDEPALGLHARAQKDFLRFINERLANKRQTIYSTHSPFMVEPSHLERARIVEDRGREIGATVTSDIFTIDPDTLFPLQGALGYDLVQHILIGPNNLIVEGTSDYTYLQVISDFLADQDRTHLDPRWSIVPVGGADKIPTFVALLGHHLDVTVLLDSNSSGNQRLSDLAAEGYLAEQRIVPVGEILGRKRADTEDLFTTSDYLLLYNEAFNKTISEADLTGTDPIVKRIARHEGVESYNHGKPSDVLLRRRSELLPQFDQKTLDNFEKLIERINATLPSLENQQ